jgi:hypothetical protein
MDAKDVEVAFNSAEVAEVAADSTIEAKCAEVAKKTAAVNNRSKNATIKGKPQLPLRYLLSIR